LRRSLMSLRELMRRIRHDAIKNQIGELNAFLRGRYAYYGIAGGNL
jgi:RNA-directed DNA polymerase